MPAGVGPKGLLRQCQEADAAHAGCIGKSADAAGTEKTRGTDPSGVLKRSLSRTAPASAVHAYGRSITHPRGCTAKPRWPGFGPTGSTRTGVGSATRAPA